VRGEESSTICGENGAIVSFPPFYSPHHKPKPQRDFIEEKTNEVLEACKILMRSYDTKILEFQTFLRENAPTVRAYLFESLHIPEISRGESAKKERNEVSRALRKLGEKACMG
jgi:hypothetical protein